VSVATAGTPPQLVARLSRKNIDPPAPKVSCSRLWSLGSVAHHVPINGLPGAALTPPTIRIARQATAAARASLIEKPLHELVYFAT